ncbi:tetratricopeptide repeat protein [Streptomyces vinaceus]|uniref:tetratricopeptide repeat protein n=1 Tax=Streptomyces vinaceus TaxID=1960 RepID=UPI00368CA503
MGKKKPKRRRSVHSEGASSIAVSQNFGIASTGSNAHFDMRRISVSLDSPESVPVIGASNLPFVDTSEFVGRQSEMDEIAQLGEGSVCVIHGLGGSGKSRVALESARVGVNSRVVTWWIVADSSENVMLGLAGLTQAISPQMALGLSTSESATWAMNWLQRTSGWLIVLDNVEDPRVIRDVVARPANGRIVVTSRRRYGWEGLGTEISLSSLIRAEAVQLLAGVIGVGPNSAHLSTLHSIAEELGDLPLGLIQAGSYVTQSQVEPDYYLGKLRSHASRMYKASIEGRDPERTIARVWDITLEAISSRNPAAITILEILSCFASNDLPRELMAGALEDELDVTDALTLLAAYSMIQLGPSSIDIHRLVQAVVRSKSPTSGVVASGVTAALDLIAEFVHGGARGFETWPKWRTLVPHIEELIHHLPSDSGGEKFRYLLGETASFYGSQDQPAEAIRLRERALAASISEGDQESICINLSNLAEDYKNSGDLLKAVELAERAVEVSSRGGEDSDDGRRLHALEVRAAIRYSLGDAHGATEDMSAVMKLLRSMPPDAVSDRSFVSILNNAAAIARDSGLYDKALSVMMEALRIAEKVGIDGPERLYCLANLAALHRDVGRPADGLPFAKKALKLSEEIYGVRHTLVIAACSNLAALYRALQRPNEAMTLARRALEDACALLGEDSSLTAICMNNLCADYINARQYDDALILAKQALRVTEANLGDGHPSLANRLSQLAAVYFFQERPLEALQYAERAVQVAAGTVGKGHPLTISTLSNLAINYEVIGDLEAAAWVAAEGYDQSLARFGPSHESTRLFQRLRSNKMP